MSDFEFAVKEFKRGVFSLVVVKGGELLFSSRAAGILPLLQAQKQLGKELAGTAIADKVVGKAAALLVVYFKVAALYTPTISEKAEEFLKERGFFFERGRSVPWIADAGGRNPCPLELLTGDLREPEQAFNLLCERFGEVLG